MLKLHLTTSKINTQFDLLEIIAYQQENTVLNNRKWPQKVQKLIVKDSKYELKC